MTQLANRYRTDAYEPAEARLDAGEHAYFYNELRSVDKKAYMKLFPTLKAREIIPTILDVEQWAASYDWREFTPTGQAKFIHNAAEDLPLVDVTGKEFSQTIKDCGVGYQFTLKEIKRAAAVNRPLDQMRAVTARQATEQLIDTTLAKGAADLGLYGLLNQDALPDATRRPATYTLAAKQKSGAVAWGSLQAPIATGREIADDLIGFATDVVNNSFGVVDKVRIALSINGYNLADARQVNAVSGITALEVALKSQFIESITPWYQCTGAGAGGATDRMVAFWGNELALGGLVPMDWTPQQMQQRNMAFVVNCIASCGGVLQRAPFTMRYADGY